MARNNLSSDSLKEATRSRARFSGHGNAKGAGGLSTEGEAGCVLSRTGDTEIIDPSEFGYQDIRVSLSWDEMIVRGEGWLGKFFTRRQAVDLDLGCLYEMQNGERGVIQAFGELFGNFEDLPYIYLSGDERSGETEGDDEVIKINGKRWHEIKRLLFYVYIYDGVPHWGSIRPRIFIDVPGEKDMTATPGVTDSALDICAVAGIENVRNGMKITNYTEYFPGHAEMDRAFGFGIQWISGNKS